MLYKVSDFLSGWQIVRISNLPPIISVAETIGDINDKIPNKIANKTNFFILPPLLSVVKFLFKF